MCLSGLNSIYLADQMIRAGDAEIVVAGGMESMTQAPLPPARRPCRLPHRRRDADRLDDARRADLRVRPHAPWAWPPSSYNEKVGITRERQDAFAAASHEKAAAAAKEGRFAEEIVPVQVPQRKGDPLLVDTDEGVRPGTTAESLGALRPAFAKDGTITAGNASQISDGGAAVVVMSAGQGRRSSGVTPLGRARRLRHGGRPRHLAADPAVAGHHQGGAQGRRRPSATSTSSRSTRRSPRSGWPRSTTSASTRTRST